MLSRRHRAARLHRAPAALPGSYESTATPPQRHRSRSSRGRRRFASATASRWVYLADEFYLNAGVDLPPAEHYDGFPQYENGIGIVRDFARRRRRRLRGDLAARSPPCPPTLASRSSPATLFAPVLASVARRARLPATARVRGARGAQPLLRRQRRASPGCSPRAISCPRSPTTPTATSCFVPDVVVNADGLLLDDVPVAELGMQLGQGCASDIL